MDPKNFKKSKPSDTKSKTKKNITNTKKDIVKPEHPQTEGNTKPQPADIVEVEEEKEKRPSLAKYFCFTLNNWTETELKNILDLLDPKDTYIIGKEIGEQGTPHLQGFIKFFKKTRPIEKFNNKRIHWELCKGSEIDNVIYCSKDNNYITNYSMAEIYALGPLDIIPKTDLKPWQLELTEIIKTKPDRRKIYWYWSEKGNLGKSALSKYIKANNMSGITTIGGKKDNVFNGIAKFYEAKKRFPSCVIIDCPRAEKDFISYAAIEKLKDGYLYSGKYEGSELIFNPPHIIVFANREPEEGKLSDDRLIIINVDE